MRPPVVTAGIVAGFAALGGGPGVRRALVVGYMFVPIGLAVHLAHSLAHLLLEGGGIVPAVQRAVLVHTPWSLRTPDREIAPRAPASVVTALQMAALVGFCGLAVLAAHRLSLRVHVDARAAGRAFLPVAALAVGFTATGIVLLRAMGMRHAM